MRGNPRRLRGVTVLAALLMAFVVATPTLGKQDKAPIDIQILGLNDFHGQLEPVLPTASSAGRSAS